MIPAKKRNDAAIKTGILIALLFVLLAILVNGFYQNKEAEIAESPKPKAWLPKVGETCLLHTTWIVWDRISVDEFFNLCTAGDEMGMSKMIADGQVILCSRLTEGKILELEPDFGKVRLMSGEFQGKDGWTLVTSMTGD